LCGFLLRALSKHRHFSFLPPLKRVAWWSPSGGLLIARIERGQPISPAYPTDTEVSAFPVVTRWASTGDYQAACASPHPITGEPW